MALHEGMRSLGGEAHMPDWEGLEADEADDDEAEAAERATTAGVDNRRCCCC